MPHQKCNIAYGSCQLYFIVLWFPYLNTRRIGDDFVTESYKFPRNVCLLYFFDFLELTIAINEIPIIIPDQAVRKFPLF